MVYRLRAREHPEIAITVIIEGIGSGGDYARTHCQKSFGTLILILAFKEAPSVQIYACLT